MSGLYVVLVDDEVEAVVQLELAEAEALDRELREEHGRDGARVVAAGRILRDAGEVRQYLRDSELLP